LNLTYGMLAALSRAIDAHDPSAAGHSLRVNAVAEAIAMRLGWPGLDLETLRLGGWLHDVGKLSVPDEILRKPGPLTAGELEQMRLHPVVGAELLVHVVDARAALPCVLYHHERWDGGGYPLGRAGHRIPAEARILAVADAFDAMTSTRPYRRALSVPEALAEVEHCAGSQFDPDVAEALIEVWTSALAAEPGPAAVTFSARPVTHPHAIPA
jgi:putative nucleotidyltransferase with HDIG domain